MEIFNQLKELLEGALITEVLEEKSPEALCRFKLEKNGKKFEFTVFKNDLGTWIEGLQEEDRGFFDLQDMFEKIFDHNEVHNNENTYNVQTEILSALINFKCSCGKMFKTSLKTIRNSEYFELLRTPEQRDNFAKILNSVYIQNKDSVIEALNNYKL